MTNDNDRESDVVYRVEDANGDVLPDGEYEDDGRALDRRAREMGTHPDGDQVTVERYERVTDGGKSATGEQQPCQTEGCDGEMYLAVPEASEWCCDDCRTAYVRVRGQGFVGGVDV